MGLSLRDFAKQDGCGKSTVHKAVQAGRLPTLPDGTIDPALVGSGWRAGNRRKKADETPQQAADRQVLSEGRAPYTLVEAERIKENYLARLRQLEYDLKVGEVVRIADVAAAVGAEHARVKTKLLALGAKLAPRLLRKTSAVEVKDLIDAVVIEALEELSSDYGPYG